MMMEMEGPAASGKANGAKSKAAGFTVSEYRNPAIQSIDFEHVSVAALRVAHLVARVNLDPARAAMLAALIFGEVPQ